MKLGNIVDPRFKATLKKLARQEIPLRTAFKLRGILKRLSEELEKYEDVRQAGLRQHGNKDEQGGLAVDPEGNVKFSPEGMQAFAVELNNLTSMDVDLGTLSASELGDKLNITTNELIVLDSLLVE